MVLRVRMYLIILIYRFTTIRIKFNISLSYRYINGLIMKFIKTLY